MSDNFNFVVLVNHNDTDENYTAMIDCPPFSFEVDDLSSEEIASFVSWAASVQSSIANRLC